MFYRQARQYNPKTVNYPTFEFDNLTQGADTSYINIKTFAQTLTKELPDGITRIKSYR